MAGLMVISGGDTPGQSGSQYSHVPEKTPFSSTSFGHQGVASPSIVVQVVWTLPLKMKGKTQFPQPIVVGAGDGAGDGRGDGTGDGTGDGDGADVSPQVADSSPTACIASLF